MLDIFKCMQSVCNNEVTEKLKINGQRSSPEAKVIVVNAD